MIGEIEGQVLSYPNGVCVRHNAALISMDGRPHCLKCGAEAARLERRPAGTNTVSDPGHEAMKALLKEHIKEIIPAEEAGPEAKQAIGPQKALMPLSLTPAYVDFNEYVVVAVHHLQKAPMPKDLKQFKLIQKAIALLQKASDGTQEK